MFQVPNSIHMFGLEAVQACAQKQFFGAWKIAFLQSPISSHKAIRGHSIKRNRKGELQPSSSHPTKPYKTHKISHINSNLRIWQSYPRVPQILKVLSAWYSWKYAARIGIRAPHLLIQCILIQYSSCTMSKQRQTWLWIEWIWME